MKSGILLVDKPKGVTSHDVVDNVRIQLGHKEVGHAGTLDPMAEGLLVLLIGEATKLSEYILTGEKAYRLRVEFGIETDTLDKEGKVLREVPIDLEIEKIRSAALKLQGVFQWEVPTFSAIKVKGKKLYDYARAKQPVDLPIKEMRFSNIDVIEIGKNFIECHLRCSKGSYIRAWARELGRELGVPSVLAQLVRTESVPYHFKSSCSLAEIAPDRIIPLKHTLMDWTTVTIKGREETLMLNGQIPHDLARRLNPILKKAIDSNQIEGIKVLSASSGHLLAIICAEPGVGLKIRRIFNPDLP